MAAVAADLATPTALLEGRPESPAETLDYLLWRTDNYAGYVSNLPVPDEAKLTLTQVMRMQHVLLLQVLAHYRVTGQIGEADASRFMDRLMTLPCDKPGACPTALREAVNGQLKVLNQANPRRIWAGVCILGAAWMLVSACATAVAAQLF